MLKDLAPSNQKYSDDPIEQAYAAHVERITMKLGVALIGLLSGGRIRDLSDLQDFAWEMALDFVAPLEPYIRDELRAARTGLPWAGRLEPELYWRLMYSAHVERLLDRQVAVFDERTARRPVKQVVSAVSILLGQFVRPQDGPGQDFLASLKRPGAAPIGNALYQGVIKRASRELRLRAGLRRDPKPVEPGSRVRAGDVMCIVEGYGFDSRVIVSRETEPGESGGLDWELDLKRGRWTADAWPWQIDPLI